MQWNRNLSLGTDTIDGRTADGDEHLPFDTVRSIARRSNDSSIVTLADGRELVLSGTRAAGRGNLGVYVDDHRYGRVLIPWRAFDRVDFSPGGSGPAHGDFPPGRPLRGQVETRSGRQLDGRIVFDLDESETTETLDAPVAGVDYTLPFGLVASVQVPADAAHPHASITLHSGETLQADRAGDLSETNAGVLVFVDGRAQPEYVAWAEVSRVRLDRPPAPAPR